MASAGFFSGRFVAPPPPAADGRSRCGFPQLLTELLEFAELRYLLLGFADRRRGGQGLGDRLALDLIGEPEIGAVTRLTGLVAATLGLTTPTRGRGNAARP